MWEDTVRGWYPLRKVAAWVLDQFFLATNKVGRHVLNLSFWLMRRKYDLLVESSWKKAPYAPFGEQAPDPVVIPSTWSLNSTSESKNAPETTYRIVTQTVKKAKSKPRRRK